MRDLLTRAAFVRPIPSVRFYLDIVLDIAGMSFIFMPLCVFNVIDALSLSEILFQFVSKMLQRLADVLFHHAGADIQLFGNLWV